MRTLLPLVCLIAVLCGVGACESSAKKKQPQVYTAPIKEQDSVDIARAYLKERQATTPDDYFYPRRYEGGWIVHVERLGRFGSRGERGVEPGSVRLLKISSAGEVIEFLPGTSTPQEPDASRK